MEHVSSAASGLLTGTTLGYASPFLTFVELTHTKLDEVLRIVQNNENLAWRGAWWRAYPFQVSELTTSGAEAPTCTLSISNIKGLLQGFLQQYDGLTDAAVVIYVTNAALLNSPEPILEYRYTVAETSYTNQWISFRLAPGPEDTNRFPAQTYASNFCPYRYGSVRCGADPKGTPCRNTASTCKVPIRFGGEEGMSSV